MNVLKKLIIAKNNKYNGKRIYCFNDIDSIEKLRNGDIVFIKSTCEIYYHILDNKGYSRLVPLYS